VGTWKKLATQHELTVIFMADSEPNRSWNLKGELAGLNTLNVKAMHLPFREANLYMPSWRLMKFMSEFKADYVVLDGWESPAYMASSLQARTMKSKVIMLYRSTQQSQLFKDGLVARLRSYMLTKTHSVVTAGTASTAAVKNAGVRDDRIIESFNNVDVSWFSKKVMSIRNDSNFVRKDGERVFLFVGRLIEIKNVITLLMAFKQMRQAEDRLDIVGDGPLRGSLQEFVDENGLGDVVTFFGHKEGDDLARRYAQATALVLPSLREIWGLVVNEALASGLYVVVSDYCGVAEDVAHVETVQVVHPILDELAVAMARVPHGRPSGNNEETLSNVVDLALAVDLAMNLP